MLIRWTNDDVPVNLYKDQDPGNFNEEVSRVSREAMETRYWLLPHLYTLFHQVASEGGTVIRPLHHELVATLRFLKFSGLKQKKRGCVLAKSYELSNIVK